MSNWKVSKEKIEIFSHPNADALLIGKVGSYQVVVQKGLYNDGDEVVFAPEKSVLTGVIKTEFEKYLAGPNKDRVKSVRLRGEISTGIIIPKHLIPGFEMFEVGQDVSETIIEIQGDFWHANPDKYKPDDYLNFPGGKKITASELWKKDEEKKVIVEKLKYNLLYLWENDIKRKTDSELSLILLDFISNI